MRVHIDFLDISLTRLLIWGSPLLVSGVSFFIADFLPSDEIWPVALQAILLSSPTWMLALWPLWALIIAIQERHWFFWILLFVTPWWIGTPEESYETKGLQKREGEIDLVVVNVNAYTGEETALEVFLSQLNADMLIMIEKRAENIVGMQRIVDDFDRAYERPSHHTALWCNISCSGWISPEYGSGSFKMPLLLAKAGENVCVVAVHAPPQVPIDASGMEPYIDLLTSKLEQGVLAEDWQVCKKGDTPVVIGDLNAVPHSTPYQRIVAQGLVDVRAESGIFGLTWPDGGGLLPLPIFRLDHIFAGKGAELRMQHSFSVPRSDHRGLRVLLRASSEE